MNIVVETHYYANSESTGVVAHSTARQENGTMLGGYSHRRSGTFQASGAKRASATEQDALGKILELAVHRAQRALAEAQERMVLFQRGQLNVQHIDIRPRALDAEPGMPDHR